MTTSDVESNEYDNKEKYLTDDPNNNDDDKGDADDESADISEAPARRKIVVSSSRRLRSASKSSKGRSSVISQKIEGRNSRITHKNYAEYNGTDDDDNNNNDAAFTQEPPRSGNKRKRSENSTERSINPIPTRRKRTAVKTASGSVVATTSKNKKTTAAPGSVVAPSKNKKKKATSGSVRAPPTNKKTISGSVRAPSKNRSSSVSVRMEPASVSRARRVRGGSQFNNRYRSPYTTTKSRTRHSDSSTRKYNRGRREKYRYHDDIKYRYHDDIRYRDSDQNIKFHWEESDGDDDDGGYEDLSSYYSESDNYYSEPEEIVEQQQHHNNKHGRSKSSKSSLSGFRVHHDVVAPNMDSIILAKSNKISYEKQYVTLQRRKGSATSPVWTYDYFRMASVMEDWESHVTGTDKHKYKGLVKVHKAKGACVCMLCYRNPKKELSECVVSTNENYAPSNLMRHLKRLHIEQYTEIVGERKPISQEAIGDLNLGEEIGIYEKQFVILTQREGAVKSPIWTNDYFRLVSVPEDWESRVAGEDKSVYLGLAKVARAKGPCACMLCFNDRSKTLDECVFSTNEDLSASNLMRHLKQGHPDHFEAIMGDRKPTAEEIDVNENPSSYEKQFVSLEKREGSVKSPVWTCDYFRKASLKENWESEIVGEDKTIYKGLAKVAKAKGPCVCMLCFRNKDKDLEQSVVSTNEYYNPSNLMRHLKHNHTDHYNKIALENEPASDAKKTYNETIDIGSYEKQLVYLEKREGLVTSPVWTSGYFCLVSIIPNWEIHIDGADFSRYKGLVKVSKAKGACVCMLCFHDKDKDLEQCVLSTNETYNASNLMRHLKHGHPDQFFEITSGEEPAARPLPDAIGNENERTDDDYNASNRNYSNTIEEDCSQMNLKVALEVWERKVHSFFNKCRIPARFASSPEFKELMSFTVRNAPSLKPNITKFIADMRHIHRLPSQH